MDATTFDLEALVHVEQTCVLRQLRPKTSCSPLILSVSFYDQGFADGHAHGRIHGLIEGRALGREKGFEMWEEMGFYAGFAKLWIAVAESQTSNETNVNECVFCAVNPFAFTDS